MRGLPTKGMRLIKTFISVMLCMLIGLLFNYPAPLYACMAAVIVTKENMELSFKQSIARILSTIVGCLAALVIMHFSIENNRASFKTRIMI